MKETEHKMKAMKSFSRFHDQKVGTLLIGCFLASMLFLSLSNPYDQLSQILTLHANQTTIKSETGMNPEMVDTKPLCEIDRRSDVCDIAGNTILVHGNSSSSVITLVTSSSRNESYRIRPHARKGDEGVMRHVREVSVSANEEYYYSWYCAINHTIPAIIFSVSGYPGNMFHDFTDMLIPVFLTARPFNGEVQFIVTDEKQYPWWVHKYRLVLSKLSKYPVIDFDKDINNTHAHCFSRVIVGLRCHKELSIDPERAPYSYSMRDFTRFMRSTYSLEREWAGAAGASHITRPRLLIIARNKTRAFTNVDDIVGMARDVGYEPVVAEPLVGSDVGQFARIVNTCDVLMGVHGAGLTNMVYLPENATVIQVVPWGGLGWVARYDFGDPARDMGLNYLQYEISAEESTLAEVYPRDHQVFKDPLSFHKGGWHVLKETFMDKQNVRLDVRRFRGVLLEALHLVHQSKLKRE